MYPSQSLSGVYPPTRIINSIDTLSEFKTHGNTLTLTNESSKQILFNGNIHETVVLPDVSTLKLGQQYDIINNHSEDVTIVSSGLTPITKVTPDSSASLTCVSLTGTDEKSWTFNTLYSTNPGAPGLTLDGTIVVKGTGSLNLSPGSPYVFTNPSENLGNAYDTTTGRFTVPTSGYYNFYLNSQTGNGLSVRVRFIANLDPQGFNENVAIYDKTYSLGVSFNYVTYCEENQVYYWDCQTNPVINGYQNMFIKSLF